MIQDLIDQANNILNQANPSDEELLQAENALSTYLEALATRRIVDEVDLEDVDEANRLLRELRRERSRRFASNSEPAQTLGPAESKRDKSTPETSQSRRTPTRSPDLDNEEGIDPLRKFFQSSHDPEAERLMDEAEEAFYKGNYQAAIPLYEKYCYSSQDGPVQKSIMLRQRNISALAIFLQLPCRRKLAKLMVKLKALLGFFATKSRSIISMKHSHIWRNLASNVGERVKSCVMTWKTKCKPMMCIKKA